ncbi:MAG: DUF4962 domain-containing protein [Ruminococcaceae bacterium]|nr:DUF4962 domain-containing protein [Oscillospiraceae bacterium]
MNVIKKYNKLISALTALSVFTSLVSTSAIAAQAPAATAVTFNSGTLSELTSGGEWHLDTRYIKSPSGNGTTISVEDVDLSHKNAAKILRHGNYPIPITYTPESGFSNSKPIVIEFSYKESNFGQPRLWLSGKNASGDDVDVKLIDYAGSAVWEYGFCFENSFPAQTYYMPKASRWRRIRVTVDLSDSVATLTHWEEGDFANAVTITSQSGLENLKTLTSVQLRPYTRSEDGDAIYLDDIYIYEANDLEVCGFNINNNQTGVSYLEIPKLSFNHPLAPIEEQSLKFSFEGIDSEGNPFSDVSLSLDHLGNSILPDLGNARLKPLQTYTLTVKGTAKDIWSNTVSVDESLTFTVGTLPGGGLQMTECVFSLDGKNIDSIDALSSGVLSAKLTLESPPDDVKSVWAILGIYNSDMELEAMDVKELESQLAITELTAQVPQKDDEFSAKLFLWDGKEAPVPYKTYITGGTNMKQTYVDARATDISEVITVTDSQVADRMKNVILMTSESTNALVKNAVVPMTGNTDAIKPVVVGKTAMVPLGFVAKNLGADVSFEGKTLTVTKGSVAGSVTVGDNSYVVNDVSYWTECLPVDADGDVLVSLDVVKKVLNTQGIYDDGDYIIIGSNAESFNLSNKKDKKILDAALKPMLFETPTAAEIVDTLKSNHPDNSHPRIMVTPESILQIKEKIANDATTAKWYASFLANCDANYLNSDFLKYELQGVRLLVVSRKVLEKVSNLSFAYLIEGDEKYAKKAIAEIVNVCGDNFPDWNQKHFLDVAEMAAAVGIGFDWCYDLISDDDKEIILKGLSEKGFKYGLKQFRGEEYPTTSGLWTNVNAATYPGNWVSVCTGGLNMAALAVGDETAELEEIAGEIVSSSIPHLQRLVAKFAPDGAWKEGPTYWRYSYKYFAFNFNTMMSALGTDYGLTKSPGIHKGAYFMIAMTGSVANFDLANSDKGALSCPEFMWLASRYNDPSLARYRKWFLENFSQRADFTDIMWYNPSFDGDLSGIPTETNTREFPIAATRSGYGTDQFYVAFHGADDGGGRIVDLDCGQYIIDLFGNRWVKDMGSEGAMYTSHGDEGIFLNNYPYYRMRAEAHNTIVINPGYYEDQNYSAIINIPGFEYNNRYTLMSADFTDVYEFKGAELFKRFVLADKVSMTTTVQDKVKMKVPSDFYSFIHVGGEIDLASDGRSAVVSSGNNKVLIKLLGSESLKFGKMPCVALETSPRPKYGVDDSDSWKLYIKADNVESAEYTVCITPLCGTEKDAVAQGPADISGFKIQATEAVPTVSGITVGGIAIDGFSPEKRIYTLNYETFKASLTDINAVDIDVALADGVEASIQKPTEDNRCARITVTDGASTGYYFVNFES